MPRKSQSDRVKAEARQLRAEDEYLRARLELAKKLDAAAVKSAEAVAYEEAKAAASNPAVTTLTANPPGGDGELAKFLRDLDRSGIEVLDSAESLGCDAEEMAVALRIVNTRLPRTSKRSIMPPEPKSNRVLPGGVGRS